jgi:hypothetical protein
MKAEFTGARIRKVVSRCDGEASPYLQRQAILNSDEADFRLSLNPFRRNLSAKRYLNFISLAYPPINTRYSSLSRSRSQ